MPRLLHDCSSIKDFQRLATSLTSFCLQHCFPACVIQLLGVVLGSMCREEHCLCGNGTSAAVAAGNSASWGTMRIASRRLRVCSCPLLPLTAPASPPGSACRNSCVYQELPSCRCQRQVQQFRRRIAAAAVRYAPSCPGRAFPPPIATPERPLLPTSPSSPPPPQLMAPNHVARPLSPSLSLPNRNRRRRRCHR